MNGYRQHRSDRFLETERLLAKLREFLEGLKLRLSFSFQQRKPISELIKDFFEMDPDGSQVFELLNLLFSEMNESLVDDLQALKEKKALIDEDSGELDY